MSQSPHDEFLALCALSTSGELTGEERKRVQDHLAACPSCGEAMKQYEAVVSKAIPALGHEPELVESDPSWLQDQAEASLFQRLAMEEEFGRDRGGGNGDSVSKDLLRVPLSASQVTWRNVWTLCAACVLLCIALGVLAYRFGIRRGTESDIASAPRDQANQIVLQQQVSDAGHEREVLRSEISRRDKAIVSLRHELEQQSAEMGRMKLAQNELEADLQSRQAGSQDLLQQRSELSQKLEAVEAKARGLQDKLASFEQQSSRDDGRSAALDVKVADLTRLLHDREATIDQQQELLGHDRDIRDLMGARDLYVAEVYDVARTGETKKPYGRVFYTKGKSLIFYAYDLDQQPGVKNASTFQAWGRRGPDRRQALSLGVFYVDNASKKRWVLRFDDPKALAQIDAVFVTVEPNGGSHKPSNKPLLFAYLHIDPNHP
ncbi:MAG: anti-sigma factor domain-containing protein [Terriglobales bacterium]